jgi:beta-N-acetylhexosaminidase
VQVDLAPVLDLPDGPLGARQFRSPFFGVAFARGLAVGGAGTCAKHFPGLGTLAFSTDDRPYVRGHVRDADLAPYRAAIEADVHCVMVGHGVYPTLGPRRAVLEPATYRVLRQTLGFRGITITDSLSVVRGRAAAWAPAAARAGADLLLFNDPRDAARAITELVPLARAGALDAHVARVLQLKARFD